MEGRTDGLCENYLTPSERIYKNNRYTKRRREEERKRTVRIIHKYFPNLWKELDTRI